MNRISCFVSAMAFCLSITASDFVPSGFSRPLHWNVGAELTPAWVPGSNGFLKGNNNAGKHINAAFSGSVRADFNFDQSTREGMLYKGLYQGIGLGATTFFQILYSELQFQHTSIKVPRSYISMIVSGLHTNGNLALCSVGSIMIWKQPTTMPLLAQLLRHTWVLV